MTGHSSIVVAVDPPSTLPDPAPLLTLALATGWPVVLVHAMAADTRPPGQPSRSIGDQLGDDSSGSSETPGNQDDARRELAAQAAVLAGNGIEVDFRVLVGPPVDVVITCAEVMNAAMIVVAGHRLDVGDRTVLGSFTAALLKVADRPVLVLPAGAGREQPGFVAAVDRLIELIDRDDEAAELADLRLAAEAQLRQPASEQARQNLRDRLTAVLHRFETDHPTLTSAINDVSYYLSGMGI